MDSKLKLILEEISTVIGNTTDGLTNSQINKFISEIDIDEKYNFYADKSTKRIRIFNFGLFLAQKYNSVTAIKMICEAYLNPIKWVNDAEKYNYVYTCINKILNTGGYEINKNGNMIKTNKINNIDELNEKWNSLYNDLKEYNKKKLISNEILEFCDKEAKKDFYYHVIDQVCKHLEEKIKIKLQTTSVDNSKKAWNLLEEKVSIAKDNIPFFIVEFFKANNQTSQDYQNGYVLFIKGILKYARNVFAHTSRKMMGDISKEETISILITISRCYDFLNSLQQIK